MKVIPTYSDPKMQDAVVQTLNALLTDQVEYLFGIVNVGYDKDGKTYPSIYYNDGSRKNFMLFPDSKVKSFGFWEFNGTEVLGEDEGVIYDLTFVFWGNLERINRNKNYDFTSEIEQGIIQRFKGAGATEVSYTEDGVFDDYSKYSEQDNQSLMRPNTGFKISLKMHEIECLGNTYLTYNGVTVTHNGIVVTV